MERATLKDLNMNNRDEIVVFLKKLWNSKETNCPKCGNVLETLHKKAKKSDCDWKCSNCDMVYRTISLLDELNEKLPKGTEVFGNF